MNHFQNGSSLNVVTTAKDDFSGLVDTGISISHLNVNWIIVTCNRDLTFDRLKGLGLFPAKIIYDDGLGIYPAFNLALDAIEEGYVWFLNSGDLCLIQDLKALNLEQAQGSLVLARQFNLETKRLSKLTRFPNLWIRWALRPVPHQSIFFSYESIFGRKFRTDIGLVADQCFIYETLSAFGFVKRKLVTTLFEGFGRGSVGTNFADQVNLFLNRQGSCMRAFVDLLRSGKSWVRK